MVRITSIGADPVLIVPVNRSHDGSSSVHVALHPSQGIRFPSSHCSFPCSNPSPHVDLHANH